jgi:hypothetical protein
MINDVEADNAEVAAYMFNFCLPETTVPFSMTGDPPILRPSTTNNGQASGEECPINAVDRYNSILDAGLFGVTVSMHLLSNFPREQPQIKR